MNNNGGMGSDIPPRWRSYIPPWGRSHIPPRAVDSMLITNVQIKPQHGSSKSINNNLTNSAHSHIPYELHPIIPLLKIVPQGLFLAWSLLI